MAVNWKRRRYGSAEYAHIGQDFDMSVSYEGTYRVPEGEPKYNVSVFGERLKGREPTLEAGKARAMAQAKTWLTEALAQMED